LQAAIIGVLVLPGVIEGAHLHPYEYVYYNRFVGGVNGAFRKYELDYWGTSYREATAYLNQVAPANGTVWVEGPAHLVQLYARPDLKIYSTDEAVRAPGYDYVVATTRYNLDLASYPQAPVVHVIERDGSPLTVIKKP
jgi:neutral trehalase